MGFRADANSFSQFIYEANINLIQKLYENMKIHPYKKNGKEMEQYVRVIYYKKSILVLEV